MSFRVPGGHCVASKWMTSGAGLKEILENLGFTNIKIEPFEEADGTLEKDYKSWRFPWTIISAEKGLENY